MPILGPDDEILGCGGTIARLRKEGKIINIGILSLGVTSRQEHDDLDQSDRVRVIDQIHKANSKITGYSDIEKHLRFAELPDQKFDTVPFLDICKIIEGWIDEFNPDVIFTHSNKDLNLDHCIIHRAVLTATRPIPDRKKVKKIYAFGIPSSIEWSFSQFGSFSPNVFISVSSYVKIKEDAFEFYENEIRRKPHPRSISYLRASALHWGSCAGVDLAEAFELVRSIE